jgi:FdrA protein
MSVTVNEVRKGFYLDSVALMRLSRTIAAIEGVEEAALMMGTPANREIMTDAGLMAEAGQAAGGGDLVIAVRAVNETTALEALAKAGEGLDTPAARGGTAAQWRPRTLRSALSALPDANLALISVPGDFAAAEARKAIRAGLDAMIFSDNVSLAEEAELKREARDLGRLVMGPDCGTAIIAGTPLAFANVVPRGPVGIVGASGTGTQEVSSLIAQMGGGISHAIGTGGRDLKAEVGGITTCMALDLLARDPGTDRIVLIAKPPAPEVAKTVLARLAATGKPGVVCLMGAEAMEMPAGVTQVFTLKDAALAAMGRATDPAVTQAAPGAVLGLFAGGTLAAEAQVIFMAAGQPVRSNAPVGKAGPVGGTGHLMLDLGEDEYTRGRPHPMIDPTVRDEALIAALARTDLSAILLDVVIGYGAHADPAGHLAHLVAGHRRDGGPRLIASVTGTEEDGQVRSAQVSKLEAAGIAVAPSNADAVRMALRP